MTMADVYRQGALVIAMMGGGLAASQALAAETYQFPEKPWGYESPAGRCTVCHALKPDNRQPVAPALWGVIGAEKGRAKSWFPYSRALLEKGGTWTAGELDNYLADPDSHIPGTKKSISVTDADERAEIIDYLKTLR
jgi:cytochrome c